MRRKYFVPAYFVACCGLIWLGGCQKQAKSEAEAVALLAEIKDHDSGGALPKITFSKLGHDFGEVSPTQPYKADIEFTNTGEGTLKITKVSRCCGVVAKLYSFRCKSHQNTTVIIPLVPIRRLIELC